MANKFIRLADYKQYPESEMLERAQAFFQLMKTRRSVRQFSDKAIPMSIIDECVMTAGTAPSGANQQPWQFVVVCDRTLKEEIRIAAEAEEREFYAGRAGEKWLEALEPFETNPDKPFLETAPVLIAIFEQKFSMDALGKKVKHYYSKESTGIATGLLITALHNAGLVTLTHTPSPMNFLKTILKRPTGERPFLLLVVGYPAEEVQVPDITKKLLSEIRTIL
ncbi:MAG: nitroreductase family protein [Candidatus Marinimicrobia bacterium]|nr:nitroreductase family protein [Candidatus Neomarinimicrobiota bacterium]